MGSLIKYELKKICIRPFTLVVAAACLVVLLFITVYIGLIERWSYAWGPELYGSYENTPKKELEEAQKKFSLTGKYDGAIVLRGLAAVRRDKMRAEALTGLWDEARWQQVVAEYKAFKENPSHYLDEVDRWAMDIRAWSLADQGMGPEEVEAYNAANPIYEMKAEYQFGDQWQSWLDIQELLDGAIKQDGSIASFAETFPLVQAPASFTYHGGPRAAGETQSVILGILALLLLLAGVSPVFSEEVACHTEPILQAAKYGRSRLVGAKILAGLLFAVLGLTALTLVNVLANGVIHGFEGFFVPIQLTTNLYGIPFALNFGQYLLALFGFQLLGLCAMAGLLLFLSLQMRAALPVIFTGGVFSLLCILFASQGNGFPRALAQILPPAAATPLTLLYEGAQKGLGVLPLQQWLLAVLASAIILALAIVLIVRKTHRLQRN